MNHIQEKTIRYHVSFHSKFNHDQAVKNPHRPLEYDDMNIMGLMQMRNIIDTEVGLYPTPKPVGDKSYKGFHRNDTAGTFQDLIDFGKHNDTVWVPCFSSDNVCQIVKVEVVTV